MTGTQKKVQISAENGIVPPCVPQKVLITPHNLGLYNKCQVCSDFVKFIFLLVLLWVSCSRCKTSGAGLGGAN